MKLLLTTLIIIYLSLFMSLQAQEQVRAIPYPAEATTQAETCKLKSGQKIHYLDTSLYKEAALLEKKLADLNCKMKVVPGEKAAKGINLPLNNRLQDKKDYQLTTTPKQVLIRGGSSAGAFYGIQTLLRQLANRDLRYGMIEDTLRCEQRGYMLDEACHSSGEKRVKRILGLTAYYKVNRFHQHLTDTQGWRIEIKQYPKLATMGGEDCHSDLGTLAQYYTREQIRDIIAYAEEHHIEIIPRIGIPRHTTTANKAYPEYSGGGTEEHPEFIFSIDKEETYTYLTNILKKIAALFPSPYLHIRGDEIAYGTKAWEADLHIQALLKREGLQTIKETECYFMHRMIDVVNSLGKTLVGQDKLLDLNVKQDNTIIMWWRHDKPSHLRKSLTKGYSTIMRPRKPLHFDFVQYKDHGWGWIWDGFCLIEDVYVFSDKQFAEWGVSASDLSHAKGIRVNTWTELMHTRDRVDFTIFPRFCALVESAWSAPIVEDYGRLLSHMEDVFTLFDKLNIYYFDYRDPQHHPEPAGPTIEKKEKI